VLGGAAPYVPHLAFYSLERSITDSTNNRSVLLYPILRKFENSVSFHAHVEENRPLRGAAEHDLNTTVEKASDPSQGGSISH
jgi:hypothetical protein